MAYGIANVNGIPNSILDTKVDKETLKTELAKKANTSHEHSADDIKSGTLPLLYLIAQKMLLQHIAFHYSED